MRKPSGNRKYKNRRATVNGITFDSQKEAERYISLHALEKEGRIRDLKLQAQFTLIEGYKDAQTGDTIKPLRYIADFTYMELAQDVQEWGGESPMWRWKKVVEDVKGYKTKEYEIKKKLMLDKFGIKIRET